jgi:RecA-family ATPase
LLNEISASTDLRLVSNTESAELVEPVHETENTLDWQRQLRKLGVYTPSTLAKAVKDQTTQTYLVDGLIRPKSINLLVGDSGLGKTPLGIQLGASVASGLPFLRCLVHSVVVRR